VGNNAFAHSTGIFIRLSVVASQILLLEPPSVLCSAPEVHSVIVSVSGHSSLVYTQEKLFQHSVHACYYQRSIHLVR